MEKDRILDESDTLGALQTITAAYIHPLLSFLAAHGLQLPEAGFELCDEKNEIIATAELCWPDKKTALLRNDEKMYEQIFVAKGWQTVALDDVIAEPSLCLKLLS